MFWVQQAASGERVDPEPEGRQEGSHLPCGKEPHSMLQQVKVEGVTERA
jgi:hypothetical protein